MTDHTHPDLEHRIEALEKDAMAKRLAEEKAAYDVQHKAHTVAAADRARLAAQVGAEKAGHRVIEEADMEEIKALNKLLDSARAIAYKAGMCAVCAQEVHHHIDEPFATCGCGTSEDTTGPGLIQRLKADLAAERAAREKAELAANVNSDLAKKHFDWYKSYQTKLAKAADGIDALLAKINGGPPQKLKLPHIVAAGGLRALDDVYLAGEVHRTLEAHGIEFEITGLEERHARSLPKRVRCPTCGKGWDTDRDGNCPQCAPVPK